MKIEFLIEDISGELLIHEIKVALFVVLDNDTRDTQIFREELEQVAIRENIVMDHVFCIAVEEMEAWLLGDRNAIQSAYIDISDSHGSGKVQITMGEKYRKISFSNEPISKVFYHEKVFTMIDEQINSVCWEKYDTLKECFGILNEI